MGSGNCIIVKVLFSKKNNFSEEKKLMLLYWDRLNNKTRALQQINPDLSSALDQSKTYLTLNIKGTLAKIFIFYGEVNGTSGKIVLDR